MSQATNYNSVSTTEEGSNQIIRTSPERNCSQNIPMLSTIIVLLITILVYLYISAPQAQPVPIPPVEPVVCTQVQQSHLTKPALQKVTTQTINKTRLPRILWIYTYHKWEGETAMNRIMFHYFNHTGHQNGYDVRIVDSWTAYEWMSQLTIDKITRAIQNVKIDETVCNMLKMALLMEHGGIMIGNLHFAMTQNNFQWIEKMFEDEENFDQYKIAPNKAEVYIPQNYPSPLFNYYFNEHIIAAVPHSTFIIETFQLLQYICTDGHIKYNDDFGFFRRNQDVRIDYIPFSIASAMTALVYQITLLAQIKNPNQYYAIQGKNIWNSIELRDLNQEQSYKILRQSNQPKNIDLIFNTRDKLLEFVDKLLVYNSEQKFEKGSLLYYILSVPENERVLLKPFPKRQIDLCLVVIDSLNNEQVQQMYKTFKELSYDRKQLVAFSDSPQTTTDKMSGAQVLKHSGNQVRNIEIALTQHCKHHGYAILLKQGESLSSGKGLEVIADAVRDRAVMGAGIDLKIANQTHSAMPDYFNYSRSRDGVLEPKLNIMDGILNHIRILSVDAFRYMPQLQLRDPYGVYFQDRIIFLATLLELLAPIEKVREKQHRHKYLYFKKYYQDIFHFPSKMVMIDSSVYINAKYYENVSQAQIIKTKVRFDVESLELSMVNNQLWGVPFSKQLVFNKGQEYVSITKKEGPQLIPKVIHQAWLGGELPVAKQYFFDKTKRLHPDYQMVLWRTQNITRDNFPVAHDIMHTLIKYQLSGNSAYSKFATVTDLLRHELMYRNGGFWRDAGMNLFKNVFDHFTRYKLVIGGEVTFGYRWNQGMCFFANQPLSQNIHRVSRYENVNRMRFYHFWAVTIAGPIDFRQVLIGDEEQSPNVLLLHFQYYYPAQAAHYPYGDKCLKRVEDKQPNEVYVFEYKGYLFVPGCEAFYSQAFGQDHNKFGVSWEART